MELTQDDLEEFVEIWKAEFGIQLSADEARYHAGRILDLYRAVAQSRAQLANGGHDRSAYEHP